MIHRSGTVAEECESKTMKVPCFFLPQRVKTMNESLQRGALTPWRRLDDADDDDDEVSFNSILLDPESQSFPSLLPRRMTEHCEYFR